MSLPKKTIKVTPGKIIKAKLAVADAVSQRAQALTGNRVGWYGQRAVTMALWLHLAAVLDATSAEDLEDAVHHQLNK
jgi:hypothetical protein